MSLCQQVSLCVGLLVAVSGCQSPRREARSAVRKGQWDRYLAKFAEMEADRPERFEALRLLHEEYEAQRSKQLDETLKRIERSRRKKNQEWAEAQPLQGKELEAIMKGRPADIQRVWDQLAK